MMNNEYKPFAAKVLAVRKHTDIEYTFRLSYRGGVRPGQFFEVSIPKYGEAPISVSGISPDYVELTIRRVGRVTNEIFEHYAGDTLFMRGPYGNGFEVERFRGKELVIIAGGTGVSPVRGVIDYFANHPEEAKSVTVIAGFKTPDQILFRDDFKRWEKNLNLILTVDSGAPGYSGKVGLVTRYLPELQTADRALAEAIVVGPPPMMRFSTAGLLKEGFREEHIWISHERKMCCGIGKCGHCKIGDAYVCLDGPVFNYTKVRELID